MDGRPKRRKKASFPNSSGVVLKGPKKFFPLTTPSKKCPSVAIESVTSSLPVQNCAHPAENSYVKKEYSTQLDRKICLKRPLFKLCDTFLINFFFTAKSGL